MVWLRRLYAYYLLWSVRYGKKEKEKKGVMPFTTSTLQQACANKYNFGASKTMKIAQKLYESVDIGTETVGLIT